MPMQPMPWSDLWPPPAEAVFVTRLVTAAVTIFVLGAWLGRLVSHPLAAKVVGGAWMAAATAGLVAWLGVPFTATALPPRNVALSAAVALGLGGLAIPPLVAAVRLPEMRRFYPELWTRLPPCCPAAARPRPPSASMPRRVALVAVGWFVYLLGYEALFRGTLLPLLVASLGAWPGMAVTTGLYVLAHLDRPSAETLAAIPTGFVFAVVTLVTGSFLAALLLHCIIATVNELAAARRAARGP
jgi:membrane protease YdiL (CAAX protease family)